jgi:hypothetical protein
VLPQAPLPLPLPLLLLALSLPLPVLVLLVRLSCWCWSMGSVREHLGGGSQPLLCHQPPCQASCLRRFS